jgi:L-lactate dehydrogenase complex protein LldG
VTARDEVLARIRTALQRGRAPAPVAQTAGQPAYRRHGDADEVSLIRLLADRLADYRALVHLVAAESLVGEIAAALERRGAATAVVPPGLGLPLPDSVVVTVDGAENGHALSAAELDAIDAVITRAAVAIAETGTIILDGSPDQGRRAISLVPDYHLCVVDARQVVELVPEAVARLAGTASRPLTWISGPSATSDIELERVEGVHGPRTLEVLLVTR